MKTKRIKITIISAIAILPILSYADIFDPRDSDLSWPTGIYNTAPADVLTVQVRTVISEGNCEIGDYSGCTLQDVYNDTNRKDKFKPEIKVQFKADDFSNADYGNNDITNAELRQRGGTSRFAPQKSYRIKLDSKDDLWREERTLQVNKHPWDLVRIRNKLSFDIMKGIPHLPSLDSQFVKLSIDDQNYGLFTHIEKIDKYFLTKRGWDKDSPLYKLQGFHFDNSNNYYGVDATGKPLDLERFERRLKIRRGKDHSKLAEMMAAVNDPNNDFYTDVIDKYFNRNNYLTWIAVNILTGNLDVANYNVYLYNPKGSDHYYFVPWDYTDTWGFEEEPDNVADGTVWDKRLYNPHHLWDSNLHKRFLKQPNAMALLTEAVTKIKNEHFTPAKIQTLLDQYYSAITPILLTPPVEDDESDNPDFWELPTTLTGNEPNEIELLKAEYNLTYNNLLGSVQKNYDRFLDERESPMTFRLDDPTFSDGNISFTWDAAFDPQGDILHYDIDVATTPDFQPNTIKLSVKGISLNAYSTHWEHPAGDYFYRVTARDTTGHWQNARDSYVINRNLESEITYYNSYDFNAPVSGTPFTDYSNLITLGTITYNGALDEWKSLQSFGTDPADINGTSGSEVDWRQAWMGHDINGNIYFANSYDTTINMTWGHVTYMDTDQSKATGYIGGGSNNFPIGVDYMIQGYHLWKYTGNGASWSWDYITPLWYSWNGLNSEMTTQITNIGSPTKIDVFFEGNNAPYGSNVSDFYPNDAMSAGKYFTYSLTP